MKRTHFHGIPVKEWRVDVFCDGRDNTAMFDTEEAAREFAAECVGHVFLLKEICDGMYEVVEAIKGMD